MPVVQTNAVLLSRIRLVTIFSIVVAMTLILACSGGSEDAGVVSAADFGDQWPLTVDGGKIECLAGSAIVIRVASTTYQLNGAAAAQGFRDIDPIWKANPNPNIPKMNIGPLVSYGLDLCD